MSKPDYNELAQHLEDFREVVQAHVSALVADGFTDREARAIIAGLLSQPLLDEP